MKLHLFHLDFWSSFCTVKKSSPRFWVYEKTNVSPLTTDTKVFKLLLQNSHFGLSGAAAVQKLLVILPHATEGDVAFESHNCFVFILQEQEDSWGPEDLKIPPPPTHTNQLYFLFRRSGWFAVFCNFYCRIVYLKMHITVFVHWNRRNKSNVEYFLLLL